MESESGTEIADSGFLIIYENPVDSGFGLPSLLLIILNISSKETLSIGLINKYNMF